MGVAATPVLDEEHGVGQRVQQALQLVGIYLDGRGLHGPDYGVALARTRSIGFLLMAPAIDHAVRRVALRIAWATSMPICAYRAISDVPLGSS